ncbi:Leucine-rich repeat receptor-like protein kinase PXL1 [Ananas comosus]|uniref:Leucine-rich repeat receptor-like protein kinase PXL1 n=1 Tax=Ananas comosus TaxID=4615 RepID=A0A199UP25_ANACO|nr:Leucine-rich repeat receptor-like protein kinase PXL1 [Ananas comosus]
MYRSKSQLTNIPTSLSHVNFTYLESLDISDNGPFNTTLPTWLWNLTKLSYLDLRNSGFHGTIPDSLGNITSLNSLYLGMNDFDSESTIPRPIKNLCNLRAIDLSGLGIGGDIAEVIRALCSWKNVEQLLLGNNKLHGSLFGWLEEMKNLSYLDLSNNALAGPIPSGIGRLSNLLWLDLSYNSLQGVISEAHFANLSNLKYLSLGSNSLIIDVDNKWIPPFQLLRSNIFVGEIPSELGQLAYLQFLDLAHNNLTGSMPRSFGNFSAMIYPTIHSYDGKGFSVDERTFTYFDYSNNLLVVIHGEEYQYSTTIYLLKIMDLSENNLSGQIPEEIVALAILHSLNLSGNHLTGMIPERLGDMRSLESLDLSLNELQGAIPQSLSALTFLNYLNLSYNNLSGRIPTGNQLSTLNNPSIYIGNTYLCGPPTGKNCTENETMPNDVGNDYPDGSKSTWPYLSIGLGFVAGFWSVCGEELEKNTLKLGCLGFNKSTDLKKGFQLITSLLEKKGFWRERGFGAEALTVILLAATVREVDAAEVLIPCKDGKSAAKGSSTLETSSHVRGKVSCEGPPTKLVGGKESAAAINLVGGRLMRKGLQGPCQIEEG